jgi:predicted MFS family arabinose efflux permease
MLQNRWAMLAVVFVSRTAMGLMFQSIAAVGPLLLDDLRLTYAQFGLLLGLFMLPGGVMSLPGGMLGQRFGSKPIALGGLGLMVLGGLVTAGSASFALAAAGRTVSGVGGVLLNVAVAKMVADWFTGREISTAMGVMLTSFPVGMALAVALLGQLGSAWSWRAAIYVTVAAAAAGLGLMSALYRDPGDGRSRPRPGAVRLSGRELALSASGGLTWSLYNAGFFVLGSFAPAYLVARGASVGESGLIVSVGIWVSLVSVPLGGYVADRLRRPNLVITAGCLATAALMALLPSLDQPALWFVLMGITFGLPAGAMMALLPGALPPDRLATGLGVYYTVFYLGIAGTLPLAGLVRDLSGTPAAPVVFAALATGASAAALVLFRWLERRRPHDALAAVVQ